MCCDCYSQCSAPRLQEFLRNIPGSLFESQRYIEFVASNDIEEAGSRASMLSRFVCLPNVYSELHCCRSKLLKQCNVTTHAESGKDIQK